MILLAGVPAAEKYDDCLMLNWINANYRKHVLTMRTRSNSLHAGQVPDQSAGSRPGVKDLRSPEHAVRQGPE
ncbi:MAG: hypothetical protein Ct9H300mP1_16280 [Planctomycetaceae bacterium]|nr:MAG: hypothetical protein Ct9H300mP1_16280 [Planctomycetaceae bacterium]